MKKYAFLFLLVFLFILSSCQNNTGTKTKKNTTLSSKTSNEQTTTTTLKSQTLFADSYDVKVNSGGQTKVTVTYDKSHPGTPTVSVEDDSICKVSNLLGNLTIKGLNYGNTKVFVRFNGEEIEINVSVELTTVEAEVSLMKHDSMDVYCILGETVDLTPRIELNNGNLSGGSYKIVNKKTGEELESTNVVINSKEVYEFVITPLFPNFDLSSYSETVKVTVLDTYESINDNVYRYIGRFNDSNESNVKFENVNSGIEISFYGQSIKLSVKNEGGPGRVKAIIDGNMSSSKYAVFASGAGTQEIEFVGLDERIHTIRVINVYEDYFNPSIDLSSVIAQKFVKYVDETQCSILFIGDSITTGYTSQEAGGVHTYSNSDSTLSFAYKTAELLNADAEYLASQGIGVKYGWRDSEWMLDLYDKCSNVSKASYDNKAHDYVVVNLGTNDASFLNKYVGENNSFEDNYRLLLEKIVDDNPNATIICLYGMMNSNNSIKSGIESAIESVKTSTGLDTIYSLFDFTAVAGRHPIESEHESFSKTLYNFIKTLDK